MPIAAPRPAATVVVARECSADGAFEVLMVRRNDSIAFMGGAYVFPGGRVDEHDLAEAQGDESRAFRLAAARELHEEAGVRIEVDALVPFAHWITPEVETRRYDTRFFLARMPANQDAQHDNDETTELAWLTPDEAIARSVSGELLLPPPTWTTLKQMQRHRTVGQLFAWAAQLPSIPAIQPHFLKDAERTMLTLPGDPTYPAVVGWEVPEDTRFLLRDGRWRPVRP
jgi:8-oxo-dGTP pyrophosphatase MutT (NUDIX family)